MTSRQLVLADIMDTARWIAFYRAVESERPDALFHDPLARRLADRRGEEIAHGLSQSRTSAWITAVRTRVFDELILREIGAGTDTILNLAAGLDTRPYRLALPPSLRWIEVDLPAILTYKQEKLAHEQPLCLLERVPIDLANVEARKRLFARVGAEARRVLVVTEGFLLYLAPEQVAALASDLYAIPSFHSWLTALASPFMVRMLPRTLKGRLAAGNARMQFAPREGPAFFQPYGWQVADFRPSYEEARRLKRELPAGWLLRILAASKSDTRTASGGFLLLTRAPSSR